LGIAIAIAVGLLVPSLAAAGIRVQVVNRSGHPAGQVYVMLSGGSSSDGQLRNEAPAKLSELRGSQFTVSSLSGRVYLSYGAPVTSAEPPRWPTRYDKVELTYPGVANLTAVDFFGIPFKLQAQNAAGRALGTLTWNAPTDTVKQALLAIPGARGALVSNHGAFVRILSPQLSPGSYPSFTRYIESLKATRLTLRGSFFGNPFQTFDYDGVFGGSGATTLIGKITPKGGPPAQGAAFGVDGSTVASAIYTVDGPYTWGGSTHRVSDNDVYSAIYRDLIAGFAWGYWGGKYGNDSAAWQNKPPFEAARKRRTSYATYNQYAAVVYRYSDAYGFSFSDTGPKKVQLPLGAAARTLQITILPDKQQRPRR
jgi:hypothetical protein